MKILKIFLITLCFSTLFLKTQEPEKPEDITEEILTKALIKKAVEELKTLQIEKGDLAKSEKEEAFKEIKEPEIRASDFIQAAAGQAVLELEEKYKNSEQKVYGSSFKFDKMVEIYQELEEQLEDELENEPSLKAFHQEAQKHKKFLEGLKKEKEKEEAYSRALKNLEALDVKKKTGFLGFFLKIIQKFKGEIKKALVDNLRTALEKREDFFKEVEVSRTIGNQTANLAYPKKEELSKAAKKYLVDNFSTPTRDLSEEQKKILEIQADQEVLPREEPKLAKKEEPTDPGSIPPSQGVSVRTQTVEDLKQTQEQFKGTYDEQIKKLKRDRDLAEKTYNKWRYFSQKKSKEKEEAAKKIQSAWRGRQARKNVKEKREEAENDKNKLKEKSIKEEREEAARRIQRAWRKRKPNQVSSQEGFEEGEKVPELKPSQDDQKRLKVVFVGDKTATISKSLVKQEPKKSVGKEIGVQTELEKTQVDTEKEAEASGSLVFNEQSQPEISSRLPEKAKRKASEKPVRPEELSEEEKRVKATLYTQEATASGLLTLPKEAEPAALEEETGSAARRMEALNKEVIRLAEEQEKEAQEKSIKIKVAKKRAEKRAKRAEKKEKEAQEKVKELESKLTAAKVENTATEEKLSALEKELDLARQPASSNYDDTPNLGSISSNSSFSSEESLLGLEISRRLEEGSKNPEIQEPSSARSSSSSSKAGKAAKAVTASSTVMSMVKVSAPFPEKKRARKTLEIEKTAEASGSLSRPLDPENLKATTFSTSEQNTSALTSLTPRQIEQLEFVEANNSGSFALNARGILKARAALLADQRSSEEKLREGDSEFARRLAEEAQGEKQAAPLPAPQETPRTPSEGSEESIASEESQAARASQAATERKKVSVIAMPEARASGFITPSKAQETRPEIPKINLPQSPPELIDPNNPPLLQIKRVPKLNLEALKSVEIMTPEEKFEAWDALPPEINRGKVDEEIPQDPSLASKVQEEGQASKELITSNLIIVTPAPESSSQAAEEEKDVRGAQQLLTTPEEPSREPGRSKKRRRNRGQSAFGRTEEERMTSGAEEVQSILENARFVNPRREDISSRGFEGSQEGLTEKDQITSLLKLQGSQRPESRSLQEAALTGGPTFLQVEGANEPRENQDQKAGSSFKFFTPGPGGDSFGQPSATPQGEESIQDPERSQQLGDLRVSPDPFEKNNPTPAWGERSSDSQSFSSETDSLSSSQSSAISSFSGVSASSLPDYLEDVESKIKEIKGKIERNKEKLRIQSDKKEMDEEAFYLAKYNYLQNLNRPIKDSQGMVITTARTYEEYKKDFDGKKRKFKEKVEAANARLESKLEELKSKTNFEQPRRWGSFQEPLSRSLPDETKLKKLLYEQQGSDGGGGWLGQSKKRRITFENRAKAHREQLKKVRRSSN